MSNHRIASRIIEVIIAYETGLASASAVAAAIEVHEPALEALPRAIRDDMHRLSMEIIMADLTPLEEDQLGIKSIGEALSKLKTLLQSIR